MTPRPWLTITSMLALLIGVVLGLLFIPTLRTQAHLGDIASSSFETRQQAWNWLKSSPEPLPVDQVNLVLVDAPPEALIHGARELQGLQSWGWDTQPNVMMAQYLKLLMWRSHIMDMDAAIILIDGAPADMPEDTMLEVGDVLFSHPDSTVARRGFDSMMGWCGLRPVLPAMLEHLPPQRLEWGLPYQAVFQHGDAPMRVHPGIIHATGGLDTREEHLLLRTVQTATNQGDASQRRRTAERWLKDVQAEYEIDSSVAPPPGTQRRIAGALLAAHEHLDPVPIEQAMVIEQDAVARTVMRLAIDAIGPAWNDDDPMEFARRALPTSDGASLYPIYLRMVGGDLTLLGPLLNEAAGGSAPARARAIALISWILPEWIEVPPDIGAETMKADIFYEHLLARWRLEHRWVVNSADSTDDVTHD